MHTQALDYRRLRAMLAERRITQSRLAVASDLNRAYLNRILCGYQPGELALIKLERGMKVLGLDREAKDAA
jgi:transcriptional regulator with XRE-family HTH domain